jgi:hypothetical protein
LRGFIENATVIQEPQVSVLTTLGVLLQLETVREIIATETAKRFSAECKARRRGRLMEDNMFRIPAAAYRLNVGKGKIERE